MQADLRIKGICDQSLIAIINRDPGLVAGGFYTQYTHREVPRKKPFSAG
jgi:hypothetical protein